MSISYVWRSPQKNCAHGKRLQEDHFGTLQETERELAASCHATNA